MIENNTISIEEFQNEQSKLKKKKIIKIIIIIALIVIIVAIIAMIIFISTRKNSLSKVEEEEIPDVLTEFNLSTFFYYDPVSKEPCNEKNYWTPFDNSSTCYRWISVTYPDSNTSNTIKLMLDHNIATSTFSDYDNILKNKTSNWSRYKGIIDIIDEDTIFNLMNYANKPNKASKVIPSVIVNHYSSQSFKIYDGKIINENGYWTKTSYEEDTSYAYTIDYNGNNEVIPKSSIYGIRPVINIKKSLLNIDPGVIDITDIIKNTNYIYYECEEKQYDGNKYEVLQGITLSKDKLFFMSSNSKNPEKGVMYSYKLNDMKNIYKIDYSNTGHGNGMTYNSKTGKVLVLGYYGVYEYNEDTLDREKEYNRPNYAGYSAIGYDYNEDLYIGRANHRIFFANTTTMKKLYEYGIFMFEAAQDLEYYNGYIFDCGSDFGLPNPYQIYSFYPGYEFIYIYDAKFDKNKRPTKNFGRLIARLIIKGLGELESLSFRDGYVYFGFGKKGYNFYYIEFEKFINKTGVKL